MAKVVVTTMAELEKLGQDDIAIIESGEWE